MIGRPQLDVGVQRFDRGVPLLLAVGLPIEIAAGPIENVLGELVRGECRKVKREETAAAGDLFRGIQRFVVMWANEPRRNLRQVTACMPATNTATTATTTTPATSAATAHHAATMAMAASRSRAR